MTGIIIVTHGQLGSGLLQSAQSIVGPQDCIEVVSITPHDSLTEIRSKCADMFERLSGDKGVMILTDILGGTSCNASLPLIKKKAVVMTGVNLPMLLSALIHRKHCGLNDLAHKVLEDGRKSLINASDHLRKKLK